MKTNNIWRCDLKSPCVKFCESKNDKNQCGIFRRDNMKQLTKQQFQELAFPIVEGKNVIPAKMELLPGDKGLINGNLYIIEVKPFDGLVILEKINYMKGKKNNE